MRLDGNIPRFGLYLIDLEVLVGWTELLCHTSYVLSCLKK